MNLLYKASAQLAGNDLSARSLDAGAASAAIGSSPLLPLAVVILTFNSSNVILRTVRAALAVSQTVFVVDSGSSDDTVSLARALGCRVAQRPFINYADQRNWAIDEFGHHSQWQLHLDADEVLDTEAIAAIGRVLADPGGATGFIFERRTYFLGRPLRFGGATNYHLRLFKSGTARCEDRLYDQHFVSEQPATRIGGLLHDMNVGSLTEWTARHNRWSDLEAAELRRKETRTTSRGRGQIKARLSADPRERRRMYKHRYYCAPPVARAFLLFFFRYIAQGGFLDGRPGFYYAFFQALWFRMLVDAKLDEAASAAALE